LISPLKDLEVLNSTLYSFSLQQQNSFFLILILGKSAPNFIIFYKKILDERVDIISQKSIKNIII